MASRRRVRSEARFGKVLWLGLSAALCACNPEVPPDPQPAPSVSAPPPEPERAAAAPLERPERTRREAAILARFEAELAKHPDLTYDDFIREAGVKAAPERPLGFDPTQAPYFAQIASTLELTDEEKRIFEKTGVVAVDHGRAYSIGGIYNAIYALELPVLITSDSVLHALHRSYDNVLMELETEAMAPALDDALTAAHGALAKRRSALASPGLAESAGDVDVYLAVARSLLAGKLVPPKLGRGEEVEALLAKIATFAPARAQDPTALHGGSRVIDFSQFRPRGHYTESEALHRYFQMAMWLGRADVGFMLGPPDPQSGLVDNSERETRSAALLAWTLREGGKLARIREAADLIDFFVGVSDGATLDQAVMALDAVDLGAPKTFADVAKTRAFATELGRAADQNIRSQHMLSDPEDPSKVKAPKLFQLLGQRFTIDGFILGQVVFDAITVRGVKQERYMPSPLDVMASLGSDEAALLLRPELELHHYGSNLLAARRIVDARSAAQWEADLYDLWLDAIRSLHRTPSGEFAPAAMQGEAWRRKSLETQLSSWSQLRHDTTLYVKESYAPEPACGYPAAYVEPHPELYAKLAKLARRAAERLKAPGRDRPVAFFERYAQVMDVLERLAKKELAAKPFTADEDDFLRKTIDASARGSGPPRYDGWYRSLIYGEAPDRRRPTIAAVHTDAGKAEVLQVGVGNATFLVVAVDNGPDRAAYVGPISSFYSFTGPAAHRLTDDAWEERLFSDDVPSRPAFTSAYRAPVKARKVQRPATELSDPRIDELKKKLDHESVSPVQRARYQQELAALLDRLRNPPLPADDEATAPKP